MSIKFHGNGALNRTLRYITSSLEHDCKITRNLKNEVSNPCIAWCVVWLFYVIKVIIYVLHIIPDLLTGHPLWTPEITISGIHRKRQKLFLTTLIGVLIGIIIIICAQISKFINTENTFSNANTKQEEVVYPECDDIVGTLRPMKKERTEQLKPLLEDCKYVLNEEYSLWYRNTTSLGNGKCSSDEMIKNLFIHNPDVYIVHPIKYSTYYSGKTSKTKQDGYSTFDDLIEQSEFYEGKQKLSKSEIDVLLQQNLPENFFNPSNPSQATPPKANAPIISHPKQKPKSDFVVPVPKNSNTSQEEDNEYNYPIIQPIGKDNYSSKSSSGNYYNSNNASEPDFGPYMSEVQRRIKANWYPPQGAESKRVILLFQIGKDGRLLSIRVHKSSGSTVVDNAAMSAVRMTAPFEPLPAGFKGQSVDIQFTFDYNVIRGANVH